MATLAIAGSLFSTACDQGEPGLNDASRGSPPPTVSVTAARVTTAYDASGRAQRSAIAEGSGETLEGVAISTVVELTFDRFLLPGRIIRQAVCLQPAANKITSAAGCSEPFQAFTEPAYDPVSRTVTYRLPEGSRLAPDTLYRLTVFPSLNADSPGFMAFDGALLARTFVFDFKTQGGGGDDQQESLPGPDTYCAARRCFEDCAGDPRCEVDCTKLCVEQQFDAAGAAAAQTCAGKGDLVGGAPPLVFESCAFGSCHAADGALGSSPDPSRIPAGLDLFSKKGIAATALGRTAHQTQMGESALQGEASPGRFGRAMPLIDPGHPGNSYLLYKLLVNPLNHPRPEGRLPGKLGAELARLHSGVVVGLPMPTPPGGGAPSGIVPLSSDSDGQLSYRQMLLLSSWIANGAVLDCP